MARQFWGGNIGCWPAHLFFVEEGSGGIEHAGNPADSSGCRRRANNMTRIAESEFVGVPTVVRTIRASGHTPLWLLRSHRRCDGGCQAR